jgi:hypothetical protein
MSHKKPQRTQKKKLCAFLCLFAAIKIIKPKPGRRHLGRIAFAVANIARRS